MQHRCARCHTMTSAKINISYSILFHLTTSYSSYFGGKKGISRNKTSFFLLMEAIGSLMYAAVATQPDITFAISTLSQFLENLGEAHWKAAKHIFHYLNSTRNVALTYGGERHDMLGYTDAHGASQEHCQAIFGYAFIINGGAISWSSQTRASDALHSRSGICCNDAHR